MSVIDQLQRDGFTVHKTTATVVAVASRSSTGNSGDMTNQFAKGARVYVDVTSASGSAPTLDVKVQSKDNISTKYVDIPGAAFSTISGATTMAMTIYPGIAAASAQSVSEVLTFNWRIVYTIGGDTPAFEFGINADLIA